MDAQTMRDFGIGWADGEWTSLHDHLASLGYKDEEILDFFPTLSGAKAAREDNRVTIGVMAAPAGQKGAEIKPVQITRGQLVSLVMHGKNAQNRLHMMEGGVSLVGDWSQYAKGNYKEAFAKGAMKVYLDKELINDAESHLTDMERDYIAVMEDYFAGMSKEELGQTAVTLQGWSPYDVEHYWPLTVDADFLGRDY